VQTITAFPALVDAVGGKPQQLYRRIGTGRAGLVRIGSESLWSRHVKSFFDGLPRCAVTSDFLQRCAAAIDAGCGFSKNNEPSARWEAKPYASTMFALKDLLAISHDSSTHPLVLRHSLPAVLRAMQHRWTEGTAVFAHAVEVLCKLVEHSVCRLTQPFPVTCWRDACVVYSQENAGWLGRLPLFDALAAARLLYADGDAKSRSPSAVDGVLLRFLAVLCRYPYGKHLIISSPIGGYSGLVACPHAHPSLVWALLCLLQPPSC
jgi:hypothetical protein